MATYVDKENAFIIHSLRCSLIETWFISLLPFNVTQNISSDFWKCILLQWLVDSKSFQVLEIA